MTQRTEKSRKEPLVEVRCNNIMYNPATDRYYTCNRLLGRLPKDSEYQIKCPKCGHMNIKGKNG
ncbi:MAG TPA: hypothetical protein DEP23_01650 [Ruminococcaceae bacterium]|jgi:predicted RNA-binding Zn-ribbon protein involved in translation (DUF1610 family)|nr:hypothetical protein [Oscillospiraceae bacterium]